MFCPFAPNSTCRANCAFYDGKTRKCKFATMSDGINKLNDTLKTLVRMMEERMKVCKAASEGSQQKKSRRTKKTEAKE